MFKPCVVIPVYNHEHAVGAVVDAVLATGLPCILVDDGSTAACAQVLGHIAAAAPQQIILVRHARNQGKGEAVLTGIRHAADAGYTHALQIDADGQHCVADIPRFIEHAAAHPTSLVVGYPQYDESVPAIRLYGRYLTHVWVWINTLSLQVKDSMCGFRVYPVAPVLALARRHRLGTRMDFDTEVLVRLCWDGMDFINVGTRVGYPTDGVSHFRMWRDNALISRMHATLFFGMLIRAPKLLARKWSKA
ncbi:glycosyltransferase family 2 protein [Noviherbaspirillum sedimenti]|uniref:Glycosyltransferase family 2 protein n=1 Tax=Noviherbaspirillum sedimenti TaxID=2320865 RepID=A0A3A3G479_9BURK|nr:glycosyltransferase family 2 protein [Noviherbaspirillum sedimenti]RJG02741.1 glycosyltransferase family 2 protein [Noviherbaspirillum sedimenti]